MKSVAPLIPKRLDTVSLQADLQFKFEPQHAMAVFYSLLKQHTRVFSVKMPEADYTLNVDVGAPDPFN